MSLGEGRFISAVRRQWLDFDLDVDHQPGLDRGARWRLFWKIGGIDGVHAPEIPRVFQPDSGFNDVFHCRSRKRKRGLDVFEHLFRLCFYAAFDDLAVRSHGHLTRDIDCVACADGGGKRHM